MLKSGLKIAQAVINASSLHTGIGQVYPQASDLVCRQGRQSNPVVAMKINVAWANLAGGDGTSHVTVGVYGGTTTAGILVKSCSTMIKGDGAVAAAGTVDLCTGNAANGEATAYAFIQNGMYLPFPELFRAIFTNGGAAYTAGTVTVTAELIVSQQPSPRL